MLKAAEVGLCEKAEALLAALDAGVPPRMVLAALMDWGLIDAGTSASGRRRLPHRVHRRPARTGGSRAGRRPGSTGSG